MKIFRSQRHGFRFIGLLSSGLVLLLISSIGARLALAFYQTPTPQAILTLGGSPDREEFTAKFAHLHPELEIWVSAGITVNKSHQIFSTAGIDPGRVHLDRRAIDTVTNFTSLVAEFKQRDIKHVYLITSDFHMPRAQAIATIVFGSQGIAFSPVVVPSPPRQESPWQLVRDSGRALLWAISGRTGASFHPRYFSGLPNRNG